MTGEEAVLLLVDSLNKFEVDYMVVGSFSTNAYGIARATKDADFVVQTTEEKRARLTESLPEAFIIDQQVTFETVTGHRRQIIKIPSIPFVIELFDLSDEPYDKERFARRTRSKLVELDVWLPTPEDVVVQKLRWAARAKRPKDLQDACDVIKVQGPKLDWPYIEEWCGKLGASGVLSEARNLAGEP
ncbi:MAG: nucleotidyl transferase AbiEii/AbiGii toxin family protein [Verrucomicrobiota bacterium]